MDIANFFKRGLKWQNSSGASLVELLVAIIITSVLALSVGVISMISIRSSAKYKSEMEIFSDIAYGFKLMQKHVRGMEIAREPVAPSGSWASDRLYIDNKTGHDSIFGLYQNALTNSVDFVFVPDQSDETVREVILSVPNPAMISLTLARSGNKYQVQIKGEKDKVPFDLSTVILQRRG